MSWYKKAMYNLSDWDKIFRELKGELGRDPLPEEVQDEIARRIRVFDAESKREPFLI